MELGMALEQQDLIYCKYGQCYFHIHAHKHAQLLGGNDLFEMKLQDVKQIAQRW